MGLAADLTAQVIEELWREAPSLREAWFLEGDPDWKAQVQDGTRPQRAEIAKLMMIDDMYRRLASSEWTALGHRLEPDLSDGPVVIPSHVFDQDVSKEWEADKISASGRLYDRVRVFFQPVPSFEHSITQSSPHESTDGETPKLRGKPGRTDTYKYSEPVLTAILNERAELIDLPSERLWPYFAEKFAERHPYLSGITSTPRERTFRDQLKRFRSANIGKNRQE